MAFDDSDIKIFEQKKDTGSSEDVQRLAELLDRQRQSGNLEKAKVLGETLALLQPEDYRNVLDVDRLVQQHKLDASALYQIRVLIVFCAQMALYRFLPSSILIAQAVTTFYDTLAAREPAFYENISDGTAFSFYQLSVRQNRDVQKKIGSSFAMLCAQEENPLYQELGEAVYAGAYAFAQEVIAGVTFAPLT